MFQIGRRGHLNNSHSVRARQAEDIRSWDCTQNPGLFQAAHLVPLMPITLPAFPLMSIRAQKA